MHPLYLIREGKFRHGDNETTECLHGRLKRIGYYDTCGEDGKPVEHLEVDLDGCSFRTNFHSLCPTVSLMKGLLDAALGELIVVEAKQGRFKNRHGRRPTYVHVYSGEARGGTVVPKTEYGEDHEEDRDTLLEELRTHPAYQERDRDAANEWQEYSEWGIENGWAKHDHIDH